MPGIMGGSNWPGAAVDAETGILYVPSITGPTALAVGKPDPARSNLDYNRVGRSRAQGPQGLPLVKPPWGRITAIDLNTGEHRWMVPNGETPEYVRDHPALAGIDIPRTGKMSHANVLVTKSLLFYGEGRSGDALLHVLDKATGEEIAVIDLPATTNTAPMTYMHNGRQYIALSVAQAGHPAELVVLALPEGY